MYSSTTRAERLAAIEALLLEHPDGLRQSDLARLLGVHRSTISRCMPALTALYPILEEPDGRIVIDRRRYLSRMKINLDNAMAIYLGARLLYRHSDLYNPHVVATVRKLADAIQGVAPRLATDISSTADHMQAEPGRTADEYVANLQNLTQALAERRWVRLRYHSLQSPVVTQSRLAPYLLEPYGPSFATYVVGLREPPGRIYTLKIERIVSARLTDATYEVPPDFNHGAVFRHAWGIWGPSPDGPVEVVLRFSPAVAERVRESRWHPSESVADADDGALVWRAIVGDLLEISPWIRSWGSQVMVLAPQTLRDTLAADLAAAAALYSDEERSVTSVGL